ncbi:MAG: DUF5677 domain-containing protein [Methyloligella sp. ZOD6]
MANSTAFQPDGIELPTPPKFSREELSRAEQTGDYAPILFEWYKFVGSLAALVGHIKNDSPAFKEIPLRQHYILVGLINRCCRLMLSNVALSHEGRFGETTGIVDRCIFESAVKIVWLCQKSSQEKFIRYLADGLKTELEFRSQIQANISRRGGKPLDIETRMLESIGRHIGASGLTESEIASSRKLPDLASMLNDIGLTRLVYVVGQKLGSHHVHGTWPSLLMHYLEEDEDAEEPFRFLPRGQDCETYQHQYTFVALIVLDAMDVYLRFALEVQSDCQVFTDLFDSARAELMRFSEIEA